MKENPELSELKRTQHDYNLEFKQHVVEEVGSGQESIKETLRKYGIQSHGTVLNWNKKYGNFGQYNMYINKYLEKNFFISIKTTTFTSQFVYNNKL